MLGHFADFLEFLDRYFLLAELCPPEFLCWGRHPQQLKNVTIFGDKGFKEVLTLKWGH